MVAIAPAGDARYVAVAAQGVERTERLGGGRYDC